MPLVPAHYERSWWSGYTACLIRGLLSASHCCMLVEACCSRSGKCPDSTSTSCALLRRMLLKAHFTCERLQGCCGAQDRPAMLYSPASDSSNHPISEIRPRRCHTICRRSPAQRPNSRFGFSYAAQSPGSGTRHL